MKLCSYSALHGMGILLKILPDPIYLLLVLFTRTLQDQEAKGSDGTCPFVHSVFVKNRPYSHSLHV